MTPSEWIAFGIGITCLAVVVGISLYVNHKRMKEAEKRLQEAKRKYQPPKQRRTPWM